jgi:regulator of sigma E protease
MSVVLLIVGLLLFVGLVVTHELGHFIVARRNGVEAEEFGIFFPPRIYKRKTKAGWLFSIGLLPLGGFVKLKGEHDSDTEKGSFGAASLKAKSKIMAAGVIVNLFTAFALLTVLAVIGLPKLIPHQFTIKSDTREHSVTTVADSLVKGVVKHSAAEKAGIHKKDRVLAIGPNGHAKKIVNPEDLPTLTKNLAGQKVSIEVQRGKQKLMLSAQLPTAEQLKARGQKGYLGIDTTPEVGQITLRRSTWSAPVVAVGLSTQITALTFQGLGHALGGLGSLLAGTATGNTEARQHGQKEASSQVGGPVAIFVLLKQGSVVGYQFMVFIIAIISLTLAIMNILPIPALDGGRLWITLISRGLGKPLSPKREEAINLAGFVILMALVIAVTSVDIHHILDGTL